MTPFQKKISLPGTRKSPNPFGVECTTLVGLVLARLGMLSMEFISKYNSRERDLFINYPLVNMLAKPTLGEEVIAYMLVSLTNSSLTEKQVDTMVTSINNIMKSKEYGATDCILSSLRCMLVLSELTKHKNLDGIDMNIIVPGMDFGKAKVAEANEAKWISLYQNKDI